MSPSIRTLAETWLNETTSNPDRPHLRNYALGTLCVLLERVRSDALEEAARECDAVRESVHDGEWDGDALKQPSTVAQGCARRIRELAR